MFRHECKKVISNKFLIGMFIALFLLNAVMSYTEAKHEKTNLELSDEVVA